MKQVKILSLDDNEDINIFLATILKETGCNFKSTCITENFFKEVVDFKPDLCMVDINLGEHEGLGYKIVELMRRKLGDEVVIIIMSRRNSPKDIAHALKCGANDYMEKPIDKRILHAKIDLFLRRDLREKKNPLFKIPSGYTECNFKLPLKIHSMSEEFLLIYSKDYIGKGSHISLKNHFLQDVSFIIKETYTDPSAEGFLLKVDFDPIEHAELLPSIRSLLLQSDPVAALA